MTIRMTFDRWFSSSLSGLYVPDHQYMSSCFLSNDKNIDTKYKGEYKLQNTIERKHNSQFFFIEIYCETAPLSFVWRDTA
jgi:hypothetical protein